MKISKTLTSKKSIRIVITDSGLGGLSIMASSAILLKNSSPFENVELIFFNSLYDPKTGYNMIKSEEKKVEVFDKALYGMKNRFNPDIILIACNTLSVLYPETKFSKKESLPVLGIINFGVEQLYEKLNENKFSAALLLGTETTIKSEVHKQLLINKGIEEYRIISQPCRFLESEIQKSPNSDSVKSLIEKYLSEALKKLSAESRNIYICLCCTHYEYSLKIFRDVFEKLAEYKYEIVNPNDAMASIFKYKNEDLPTEISFKVASRFKMPDDEIKTISKIFKIKLPKLANSLENFMFDKTLF